MTQRQQTFEVTIVVPTKNSETTLRACLESIRSQSYPCELIVVDNSSTDATREIALRYADAVLGRGPERSAQRNYGASQSLSSIVGFIDSDMVLDEAVVSEARDAISNGAVSVVVPETTIGEGFWARVSEFERSLYVGVDTVEAPRFFLRSMFNEVGGFDEAMTGGEDWDLGLRTAKLGTRARTLSCITHDEGRVRYFSLCKKKAYYAPGLALFAHKHGMGAIVNASRRPWLRNPKLLLRPVGVGLIVLKTGEAISMILGIVRYRFGFKLTLPSRRSSQL